MSLSLPIRSREDKRGESWPLPKTTSLSLRPKPNQPSVNNNSSTSTPPVGSTHDHSCTQPRPTDSPSTNHEITALEAEISTLRSQFPFFRHPQPRRLTTLSKTIRLAYRTRGIEALQKQLDALTFHKSTRAVPNNRGQSEHIEQSKFEPPTAPDPDDENEDGKENDSDRLERMLVDLSELEREATRLEWMRQDWERKTGRERRERKVEMRAKRKVRMRAEARKGSERRERLWGTARLRREEDEWKVKV